MNILSLIASELNGREIAVLVWLLLFICYGIFQKNFRSSFLAVLKSFFQIKIIAVFVAMLFYVFLILWGLYIIKIWDLYLVKDTIFWLFGSAFILLLNSNKAIQNDNHFKNVLKDNIRLVIFLEFILELAELFLISCLYNDKNDQIEKYSQDCRESRKSIIVRVLLGRVLEMQAHRKRNVETAEQEQS